MTLEHNVTSNLLQFADCMDVFLYRKMEDYGINKDNKMTLIN